MTIYRRRTHTHNALTHNTLRRNKTTHKNALIVPCIGLQFSVIAADEAAKMMQYLSGDTKLGAIRAQTKLGNSGWNAYT